MRCRLAWRLNFAGPAPAVDRLNRRLQRRAGRTDLRFKPAPKRREVVRFKGADPKKAQDFSAVALAVAARPIIIEQFRYRPPELIAKVAPSHIGNLRRRCRKPPGQLVELQLRRKTKPQRFRFGFGPREFFKSKAPMFRKLRSVPIPVHRRASVNCPNSAILPSPKAGVAGMFSSLSLFNSYEVIGPSWSISRISAKTRR